jgi:cell division FtsZ-interacting protein ZapD
MSQVATTPKFDLANLDALANQLETATADLTSGGVQYIKFKKG